MAQVERIRAEVFRSNVAREEQQMRVAFLMSLLTFRCVRVSRVSGVVSATRRTTTSVIVHHDEPASNTFAGAS